MSPETPGAGMKSTTGPVRADIQKPSGREKISVLGPEPKGNHISFMFSSKLWKISWLEQRSEII